MMAIDIHRRFTMLPKAEVRVASNESEDPELKPLSMLPPIPSKNKLNFADFQFVFRCFALL